jgi:hypothetical protein
VRSLAHLQQLVEQASGQYVRVELEDDRTIVVDATLGHQAGARIQDRRAPAGRALGCSPPGAAS